jgi:serine/threonine protein phosphatase PrpC
MCMEHSKEKSKDIARKLVSYALDQGTTDNLSVIVVKLNPYVSALVKVRKLGEKLKKILSIQVDDVITPGFVEDSLV